MINPKITIITPSFNQGKYLESTIQSVLNQQYDNLEYFIIDGGSDDNSVDIIRKYEKFIDYWVSEKDNGQSEAINKGLRMATGKIVTWINSDDMLQSGILHKIKNYFDDEKVGLIFGKTISFGDNSIEKISDLDLLDFPFKFLGSMAFPQPASFFSSQVLKEHGYLDESLHYGMDFDLLVRIVLNYKILAIDDIISLNRYHDESKSMSNTFNFALDWAKVFSKVLRSFDLTNEMVSQLKDLNIYCEGDDFYKRNIEFFPSDLKKAYLYFLKEQAQLYYGSFKMNEANKIVKCIRKLDHNFYNKYRLNDIDFRSTYIPVELLKVIKFLRSKYNMKYRYGW